MVFDYRPDPDLEDVEAARAKMAEKRAKFLEGGGVSRYKRMKEARDRALDHVTQLKREIDRLEAEVARLRDAVTELLDPKPGAPA